MNRTDSGKEVLRGRVAVGYVEDDFFVAIIGEALHGTSGYESCQPLSLV